MKSGYPPGDDIHFQELAEKEAYIAQLEAELAGALMCDGCAGRGDDANCGCGGSGKMADMVVSLREAALVELPEKVRRLEAELEERLTERYAQRADEIDALKAELAEKDAALAAAHEALMRHGQHFGDCNNAHRTADYEPQNCCCGLANALSFTARQRAAEELRLLRDLAVEVGGKDDVAATPGCDCLVCTNNQRMNPAWFALRRFREERG